MNERAERMMFLVAQYDRLVALLEARVQRENAFDPLASLSTERGIR